MTPRRHPAAIHLWTGDFASQQLAFAHLLDAADRAGATLDLDAVEVIPAAEIAQRLPPYLGPELPPGLGPVTVLLAAPPGAPAPFGDTDHLRYVGCRAGEVLRAGGSWA